MEHTRKCGSCAACCQALGITQLPEPKCAGDMCPHAKSGGTRRCLIYESRPAECKKFSCLWQVGGLPNRLRPNDTGVVVSVQESHMGPAFVFHEVEKGDLLRPKAFDTVARVMALARVSGAHVMHIDHDGKVSVIIE